ncbi:MAG: hypothetical protein ACFE0S_03120 [Rhodospirillales bacterium]
MPGSRQSHIQGYTPAEKLQLSIISAAIAIALLAAFGLVPAWTVRWLTTVLFMAQIAHELYDDDISAMKSPAFLLAAIAGFMYAIVPAAVVFLLQASGQHTLIPSPNRLVFLGHPAEYYILTFALLGLALHGVLRLTITERFRDQAIQFSGMASIWLSVISILLTGAAFLSINFGHGSSFVSSAVRTVYPPLQSLIIVFLVYQWAAKKAPLLLPLLTIVPTLIFLGLNGHAKPAIYIGFACVLIWVTVSRPRVMTLAMAGAALVVFIVIAFNVTQAVKYKVSSFFHQNTIDIAKGIESLGYKIIWRQIDSGNCFRNVLVKHGDDDFVLSRQTFWIAALVPRIIWPEKPNLSLGSQYSITYCDSTYKHSHSASISLLGQPAIHGGPIGILFHGAFLLAGLAVITAIARAYPGIGTVIVMALLPWWIDFDQDFALYIANLVKFFLLMCLIAVPALVLGRTTGRTQA